MKNKVVFIVDGYSTGRLYAPRLAERGFKSVHVQSQSDVPHFYAASFDEKHYEGVVICSDYQTCLDELSSYTSSPAFVIAGSEPGICLADRLCAHFATPGNDPRTSSIRRSKYLMGEAVIAHEIPAARQFLASTPNEAAAHAEAFNDFPVVVKPIDSAGSDDVTFCSNTKQVFEAADKILGKKNKLYIRNNEVLVQKKLEGTQYIVNSVSIEGIHYFTEVWEDRRIFIPGAGNIYDREVLLPLNGEIPLLLQNYVDRVLTALQVTHGPCHTEVILTAEGPRLVEVSSRLQGSILPCAIEAATGQSHLSSHLESLLNPNLFRAKASIRQKGAADLMLMSISFIAAKSGIVSAIHYDNYLPHLSSFHSVIGVPKVGETISKTIDLFSSPGTAYLVSPSPSEIEADYQKLREWERAGQLIEIV